MHVAPAGKPLPADQVKELGDRSQGTGKTVEFEIYLGAPRGFHADYRGTLPRGGGQQLPQGGRQGRVGADDGAVQEVRVLS
jgi:hypothetical protein